MWRGASSEQKEMLDWVFGAAPNGMAVVEYDELIGGKLVNANEALEIITGYSKDELIGMPAHVLIPEVSDSAEISRNELVAGKRTWWSDDVDLVTKQGKWSSGSRFPL